MEYFLAGAFAGLVTDTIIYPLDTIKTTVQVQTNPVPLRKQAVAIIQKHGGLGLYRGLPSVLSLSMPANACFYFAYEFFKNKTSPMNPTLSHLCSAALANFCSTVVYCPMEVIKQKSMLRVEGGSTLTVVKDILKKNPLGLYQGVVPALLTWTPYLSLYFVFYEKIKLEVSQRFSIPFEEMTMPIHMSCGFIGAVLAAALTNPLDVLKTRMQTQGSVGTPAYSSSFHAVSSIMKIEGPAGFFRGLQPRVFWLGSSSSLIISFYEYFKAMFVKE